MSKANESLNQDNNVYSIAVGKLVKSSLNARKTVGKGADEELKASLLAHGLMQNLVVIEGKKGKYEVVAGARRMEALKALQQEGKLPDDHEVLCQVVSDEQAYEMSLAENTVRHAMHPADEHAAFAVLIDSGKTTEEIAQRFGKTEKYVLQRLKLGRAAPELIQLYRDGKLKLETLEAFTITDDRKRQLKVYNQIKNGWQIHHAREIRGLLTDKMVDAKSKLVVFVGLENYEKAGGTLRSDLFGEDVYLENPELLNALVEEKLKLVKQELEAEGWAWVETAKEQDYSFTNCMNELEPEPVAAPQELLDQKAAIEAELEAIDREWEAADENDDNLLDSISEKRSDADDRLEQIEEKLSSFVRFTPEQMKVSGCYAYIDHRGELAIEKGLVTPKADDEADDADEADHSGDEEPEEKPKGMPESLKADLEAYRLSAAQAEIAKNAVLAFDLLVFKATKEMCGCGYTRDGAQVNFTRNCGGVRASNEARRFVSNGLKAIEATLPLAWLKADGEAEQFTAFQLLTAEQKHELLAFCVASTLQPKLAADGKPETAYDLALAQTGANVAEYWRPTAANFLSRVKSDQLLEIGAELFGESWAVRRNKSKKSQLVSELDKAFAAPDQTEKTRNWLPAGMSFGEQLAKAKAKKTA